MASKIHLFKKSAIEAGTPEKYYLNPSENLMKIAASAWRVVEHEDFLTLTIDSDGFGGFVTVSFEGKFINIEVDHKDGKKKFSIEMNPKLLNSTVEIDPAALKPSEGTSRLIISKLKK
ncbi:hypothetical protein MKW94_000581 [Papaver nudicaule]|uniref:Uncharacterized protein n=1 Tax=Papaver nudicaule TaxID=74823 RepID=A0AA41V1Y0_PAPNU|nr:hypothetical protein [Papaver nudicaule]